MILVDTSIWVEYFQRGNAELKRLLENRQVLTHPFVMGEIALGSLPDQAAVFEALDDLTKSLEAQNDEVLTLIEARRLFRMGIGYVDAHLLTATMLMPGDKLWTRDKKLAAAAAKLGIAASFDTPHN